MKDLILGFKLLRYGYKLKTNVMMLILFTAIGFVVELSSHGTNMLPRKRRYRGLQTALTK